MATVRDWQGSSAHSVCASLTALGIAAVVGAGISQRVGKASFDGGPGIILLFLFVAVACGFSALCYAEFASIVPVSGSAYTYSYVAFGEVITWIIGWDLLMEYAIGNIVVAISWSAYFTSFLGQCGIHLPAFLTMGYMTAQKMASPEAIAAWTFAPQILGFHIVFDSACFCYCRIDHLYHLHRYQGEPQLRQYHGRYQNGGYLSRHIRRCLLCHTKELVAVSAQWHRWCAQGYFVRILCLYRL
jgi:amino acid permease